MKLRRFLWTTLLIGWLTAVTSYWWAFIPPAPTHVIPLHGRSTRWTPPFGSVIALSHTGPGQSRPLGFNHRSRPPSFGPLHLYDPASGQQIVEVLESDDEILSVVFKPRQLAIVVRKDVVTAVDFSESRRAVQLEGVDPNSHFVFAEGARIVVVDSPTEIAAFDLETGDRLWSKLNVRKPGQTQHGGSEIVTAELIGSGRRAFNARTGEIDARHDFVGSLWVSQDGHRFAMSSDQHITVYAASQREKLCRVPVLSPGKFPIVQFSPDGRVLGVWEHQSPTRRLTFWDCETGQQLKRQPGSGIPNGPLSLGGDWVISMEDIEPPIWQLIERLPAKVIARLQQSTTFWNLMVRANQSELHHRVITDTFTGETLGRYAVPSAGEWLWVTDDQHGVVAFGGPSAITCYHVPAIRSWSWLLLWGLGPVAATCFVRAIVQRLRRHRPPAASCA